MLGLILTSRLHFWMVAEPEPLPAMAMEVVAEAFGISTGFDGTLPSCEAHSIVDATRQEHLIKWNRYGLVPKLYKFRAFCL